MKPTPERVPFDPSKYPPAFVRVVDEFHHVLRRHGGRLVGVTNRRYTVELEYLFPKSPADTASAPEEATVVLNVSHDAAHKFTKHDFEQAGAKPSVYVALRNDIDAVAERHQSRPSNTRTLSKNGVEAGQMISEISAALQQLNCMHVHREQISYGVKFSGRYNGEDFRFRIHFRKDEENKRKSARNRNVVWEVPQQGIEALHRKLFQVVGGPNVTVDDLTLHINELHM